MSQQLLLELFPDSPGACQRWRGRRSSYVTPAQGFFDPEPHEVRPIGAVEAKDYVIANHYSATMPAAKLRYGLFSREDDRLLGVAVLGIPTSEKVLTGPFPGLEPYIESLCLSRLVLDEDVAFNGETWMLARAFDQAAQVDVRGVVTFADPVPRQAADGSVVFPGHRGQIYQGLSAAWTGRSAARWIIVLPDGRQMPERALSKVRGQESGHEHCERRLVDLGAVPMRSGEDPGGWLREALDTVRARKLLHRGNHHYLFALGRTPRERRAVRNAMAMSPQSPYPDRVDDLAA